MSQDDLTLKFGKRLAYLRTRNALTQEQLAERAEISLDFLSLMERGRRAPSFGTLSRLAESLNVEVLVLFDFQGGLDQ